MAPSRLRLRLQAVADRDTTTGESGEDAGKKVMTIINGSSVQVSANIYEKTSISFRPGNEVQMKLPAATAPFKDKSVSLDQWSAETRVVPVKAQLDNPNGVLKPGMFAELEVLSDRTPAVLLAIPKSHWSQQTIKTIVFVQNGNAFQPTEVTLGRDAGEFVEIKTGCLMAIRL